MGGFAHVYFYQHHVSVGSSLYNVSMTLWEMEPKSSLPFCCYSSEFLTLLSFFFPSDLQVTNEKLAVKMCRLELTPRNKDRWSREIMIMKKFVIFMAFFPLAFSFFENVFILIAITSMLPDI